MDTDDTIITINSCKKKEKKVWLERQTAVTSKSAKQSGTTMNTTGTLLCQQKRRVVYSHERGRYKMKHTYRAKQTNGCRGRCPTALISQVKAAHAKQ